MASIAKTLSRAHVMLRSPNVRRALLMGILAWVAVVTFDPHHDPVTGLNDPMPVHSDEYVHWGYASSIASAQALSFNDPFSGEPARDVDASHEAGFQLYYALFHQASGAAWTSIIVFAPTVVAILAALTVYVVAERYGAGLFAAFWFTAIPTSLRFLGPGWFVPIAFALPFLGLALYLLAEERWGRALAPLAILAAALWTIHIMAAATLTLLVLIAALIDIAARPARAISLVAAVVAPLLLAHAQVETLLSNVRYTPTLPLSAEVVQLPGPAFFAAAAVGVFALAASRAPTARRVGIAIGVAGLVMGGIVVYRASTGIDPFRAYDRATLMLAFLCVVPAGVAVAACGKWLSRHAHAARLPALGAIAVAVLVLAQGVVVVQAANAQMEQLYYVNLPPETLAAYETAKEQLQPYHQRAIVGGDIPTMPFSLVTGIPTVWVRSPEATSEPEFVRRFFAEGATNTQLLIELRTSVVVTNDPVHNPDLRYVAPGVYFLRDDYAQRLGRA